MPEYLPLDLRLRNHTKRTDLPPDVLRDIGEAYGEIQRLERKLTDIKNGYEGCCVACESVAVKNNELRKRISELSMDGLAKLDEELGLSAWLKE